MSASENIGRYPGPFDLSASEVRVLGCLMEKQRTTPDAYPLSLNALCLACNQTTNRDPVVDYDHATVRNALHRLERRGFTRLASGAGSRAPKYRHLLDQALPLDRSEHALMCVLMLRGEQTPGELKQRAERLEPFGLLADVLATLERLAERELVARHARRPGQKEERYSQLLQAGEEDGDARPNGSAGASGPEPAGGALAEPAVIDELRDRIALLEREVAELRDAMRNPSLQDRS